MNILDKIDEYVDRKGNESTKIKCMECGKEFKKIIGKGTVEVKCPGCGGYDTEVA